MILGLRRWYESGALLGFGLGIIVGSRQGGIETVGFASFGIVIGFWIGALVDIWLAIKWQRQQRQ